jgi:hypothetical protein
MKKKSPTFFAKNILLAAALCGIAGCSSMPHVFGGDEVPEGALNAPRVVEKPTPEAEANQIWPRLGDVPSKPDDFSTPGAINQSMTEMESDRTAAATIRDQSGIAAAPQKSSTSSPQGF